MQGANGTPTPASETPTSSPPDAARCPFSLMSLENRDPFPPYEAMRALGKVIWDEKAKGWLVVDFELCRYVELHEEDQFRNPYADADPIVVELKGGRSNISVSQGEQHDRLRRFHMSLLSRKAMESYRANIVLPIVQDSLARLTKKGESADLAADFGDNIPPRVICALLGMPWQDDGLIDKTLRLHEEIMQWIGKGYSIDPEGVRRARAASAEINVTLLPYIRERRERPKDDFISRVWLEAPAEYGALSEEDALAICRELFLGGADTTVHGIANSFYLLLWNSEVRAAVRTNRELLAGVIEEAQRLYGSPQYRYRRANRDCQLGGVAIAKDQLIILVHGAANRDPARFGACPSAPDLNRPRPRDHLTFNYGPRTCVGSGLARMEMRDALDAVLDRYPEVAPHPHMPSPVFANLFMRSFRPLNVYLERQAGA
jgi:cytochrome P450